MSLHRIRKYRKRAAWRGNLGAALHVQIHMGVWHRGERTRASVLTLLAQWLWQARERQGTNKAIEGLEGGYEMGQLDMTVLERFKQIVWLMIQLQ